MLSVLHWHSALAHAIQTFIAFINPIEKTFTLCLLQVHQTTKQH